MERLASDEPLGAPFLSLGRKGANLLDARRLTLVVVVNLTFREARMDTKRESATSRIVAANETLAEMQTET